MTITRIRSASPTTLAIVIGLVAVVAGAVTVVAQSKRDFNVGGRKYTYTVNGEGSEIRVKEGDLVHITFSAEDIPHTFTIEGYRIDRRAEPGKPVTFRFAADKVGDHEIRCKLSLDERCIRDMRGLLKVEAK